MAGIQLVREARLVGGGSTGVPLLLPPDDFPARLDRR